MMFRSRAAQTTILATGSALAFMAAAVGDHTQAQGNLDASYTISFARIPVGEITATVVFGDSETWAFGGAAVPMPDDPTNFQACDHGFAEWFIPPRAREHPMVLVHSSASRTPCVERSIERRLD